MTKPFALMLALAVPMTAHAQEVDVAGMQAGLTMLEMNVDRILDQNGFTEVDPTTLDLQTIVEIVGVVGDDERTGSQRSAIEAALTRRLP